MGKEDV